MGVIRRASRRVAALAAVLLAAIVVSACGDDEPDDGPPISDPGPIHVHGLGINPRDGALFIATHTGLFRAGPSETQASRVGGRYQDTMGFTVLGPDRFLGSGHPDGRDNLPPFLGLIESRDGGRSWKPISLLGESDFHVLEAAGNRVYGFGSDFESRRPQFLVSSDGGKTWAERRVPESLISLALHPDDPDRLIASGESAVYESRDGGESWRRRASAAGLFAWRSPDELIVIGGDGSVRSSGDGARWRDVGDVAGQPAAFEAERDGLYVALHDGTIKRSTTGGRSWSIRSRP
jgi:hypothetical protein